MSIIKQIQECGMHTCGDNCTYSISPAEAKYIIEVCKKIALEAIDTTRRNETRDQIRYRTVQEMLDAIDKAFSEVK